MKKSILSKLLRIFHRTNVTKSSFRDDKAHGLTRNKVVSFAAVPDVLSQGEVIDVYAPKGKPYERIIIAAPITIDSEKYYMGVMVQKDNQSNRMYLHDVITEKATLSFNTEPTAENSEGIRDNGHLYITSILQNALKINPYNEKISKTESKNEKTKETTLSREYREAEAFAEKNIPDYKKLYEPVKRAIQRTIVEARANGLSDADIVTFAKFSAKSGINVAFDKNSLISGIDENGNYTYADGLFDGDNTIYINKDSSLGFHLSLKIPTI